MQLENIIKFPSRGLPWWPVVKNPPANAGDVGWIPGLGTKIPHAMGQLSLDGATIASTHSDAHEPWTSHMIQLRPGAAKNK